MKTFSTASTVCTARDRRIQPIPPPAPQQLILSTNDRYGICGRPLHGLLPFVREAVAVPISADGRARRAASPPPPPLPPSRLLLKPRPAPLDAARGASSGDRSGTASSAIAHGASPESLGGVGGGREERGQQTRTLFASMVEALGPGFDSQEQVR